VAGKFYPANPQELASLLVRETHRAIEPAVKGAKMVVAPHAGLVYSGRLAITALSALNPAVKRIVIVGPAHRQAFQGLALNPANALRTPLLISAVDHEATKSLAGVPGLSWRSAAFEGEHSIELPLLAAQIRFPHATIVPVLVGDAEPRLVQTVLERLWGGPETAIVLSSDLSHFLDETAAQAKDAETRRFIETLNGAPLTAAHACGHRVLKGALEVAISQNLRATGLDFATSKAVSGEGARVVGYGAFAFDDADTATTPEPHRALLLAAAARALKGAARNGAVVPVVTTRSPLPTTLTATRAVFVTLKHKERLRGCIGSLAAHRPLIADVIINTVKAAASDPRFQPLTEAELTEIEIGISILSRSRPLAVGGEADLIAMLRPGIDGATLTDGRTSGLFLPSVWSSLPQPADFVRGLKRKAGLPETDWSESYRVARFATESFSMGYNLAQETDIGPLQFAG
jgi:AmmeMemoRadiSam system protein B/AmmeMemoRadiSam system protein A